MKDGPNRANVADFDIFTHSFSEFLVGYIFGAALIIGAPTVFLLLVLTSALMKTNGKMGGYKEYASYGKSTLNDWPPFILPDPTKSSS